MICLTFLKPLIHCMAVTKLSWERLRRRVWWKRGRDQTKASPSCRISLVILRLNSLKLHKEQCRGLPRLIISLPNVSYRYLVVLCCTDPPRSPPPASRPRWACSPGIPTGRARTGRCGRLCGWRGPTWWRWPGSLPTCTASSARCRPTLRVATPRAVGRAVTPRCPTRPPLPWPHPPPRSPDSSSWGGEEEEEAWGPRGPRWSDISARLTDATEFTGNRPTWRHTSGHTQVWRQQQCGFISISFFMYVHIWPFTLTLHTTWAHLVPWSSTHSLPLYRLNMGSVVLLYFEGLRTGSVVVPIFPWSSNVGQTKGEIQKLPFRDSWQRSKLTKELGWTLKPVTKVFLSGFAYEMNVRWDLSVDRGEFIVGHSLSCWWQQSVLDVLVFSVFSLSGNHLPSLTSTGRLLYALLSAMCNLLIKR